MKKIVSLLIIISMVGFAFADEGMWTMDQIEKLDLNNKGLQIPLDELYNPNGTSLFNAIVQLGGGTSEFVSPKGLMLTNHHVAYGAVQRASTQGTDYLTNGFLANSFKNEIKAPGISAYSIDKIKDVTDEVLAVGAKIKNLVKRQKAIDTKIQEMTDAIEECKEDVTARIAAMYEGQQYLLYIYKRFDDIRIVYMPPLAIGNYGGEIDNWMWPRHTGDFAFARVYVAPDGTGRTYHEDNVPFEPKKWLKISTRDLDDGDFTMVMGFPGRTSRYRSSHSVKYNRELFYPEWLQTAGDVLKILDRAGEDSPDATMATAGQRKGIANYQKKYGGTVAAMDKFNYFQYKIDKENEFQEFVKSDRKLKKKYGKVLAEIGKLYDGISATKQHDDILDYFGGYWGFIGTLPRVANDLVSTAKEREKSDEERDPNFSEKDVQRTMERLHYRYMGYYEPAQKELFNYFLEKAAQLPISNRVKGIDEVLVKNNMTASEYVDFAFENSKLSNVEYAKTLSELSSLELAQLNDPFINLALAIYDENEVLNKQGEEFGASVAALRKKYMAGLRLMSDDPVYPDANSTIRFTYGNVEGYSPKDAVQYAPFTTLAGAIDKNTGESPFDLPDKLADMHANLGKCKWLDEELGDIPIAFTHAVETTNGSSGSPVLNAYGEMIGIAFDGNIESMLSDWQHDPSIQRTISVDTRYVMFITEQYAGANYLLEEMGIK